MNPVDFKSICNKNENPLSDAIKTKNYAQRTYNNAKTDANKKALTSEKNTVAVEKKKCNDNSAGFCILKDSICIKDSTKIIDPAIFDGKIVTDINQAYKFLIEKHPIEKKSNNNNLYAFRVITDNIITDFYFGMDTVTNEVTHSLSKENKYYWTINEYDFDNNDKRKNEFLLDIAKNINIKALINTSLSMELYNDFYLAILDKILNDLKLKLEEKVDANSDVVKYNTFINKILTYIQNSIPGNTDKITRLFKKIETIYDLIIKNNMHNCCDLYNKKHCNENLDTCKYDVDRCQYNPVPVQPIEGCTNLNTNLELIKDIQNIFNTSKNTPIVPSKIESGSSSSSSISSKIKNNNRKDDKKTKEKEEEEEEEEEEDSGLNMWVIVGIVIGSIAFIVIVILIIRHIMSKLKTSSIPGPERSKQRKL